LPSARVLEALDRFAPDIVHLASPFVLGAYGIAAADRLDLPSVAVYQTDVPGYAAGYGLGFASAAGWRWLRAIHNRADRTLAPSSAAVRDLVEHGSSGFTCGAEEWTRPGSILGTATPHCAPSSPRRGS
jgi:phosphatidylinositol alpha 1,6-mannosyltransferase